VIASNHADNPQGILDTIMENVELFASGRPADDDQALLIGIID
jgi:serine phosphatase RsbU (regulator of sigma subunit)